MDRASIRGGRVGVGDAELSCCQFIYEQVLISFGNDEESKGLISTKREKPLNVIYWLAILLPPTTPFVHSFLHRPHTYHTHTHTSPSILTSAGPIPQDCCSTQTRLLPHRILLFSPDPWWPEMHLLFIREKHSLAYQSKAAGTASDWAEQRRKRKPLLLGCPI